MATKRAAKTTAKKSSTTRAKSKTPKATGKKAKADAAKPAKPKTKTATRKKTVARKVAAPKLAHRAVSAISDDERRALIAEAAYLLAEARGFAPGGELADWLAAEQDIAARFPCA